MPYIKESDREDINWIVDNLAARLSEKRMTGNLNYFLYKLFAKLVKLNVIHNYETMSRFIAELEACKLEIYRKKIAPYEEKKILENGDVY